MEAAIALDALFLFAALDIGGCIESEASGSNCTVVVAAAAAEPFLRDGETREEDEEDDMVAVVFVAVVLPPVTPEWVALVETEVEEAEFEGDGEVCKMAAEKESSGGLKAAPTDFRDGFESNSVWLLAMIAEVDLFLGEMTESAEVGMPEPEPPAPAPPLTIEALSAESFEPLDPPLIVLE